MTIHGGHPFPTQPDPLRRFRGRLGTAVTLWTTGEGASAASWEGLTVTSLMVAAGEPAHVLGLLDPDSSLGEALDPGAGLVVGLLRWPHRQLSEMFAGTAPAPGGAFRQAQFEPTPWGPRLAEAGTWLGARVVSLTTVGWSVLVTAAVEHLEIGDEDDVLVHRRGRYVPPERS